MHSHSLGHVPLKDCEFVLVKFYITNNKHVPKGFATIDRKSERELIKRRMETLGVSSEKEIRGHEVINNAQMVQAAMIRRGLTANGFHLVDGHTWKKRQIGRTTKNVVVMSYRRLREGEAPPVIPAEAMQDIRALATNAVWTCHVWQNPNKVVVVDFVQRQPGVAPELALVTRRGELVALPVVEPIEVEQE